MEVITYINRSLLEEIFIPQVKVLILIYVLVTYFLCIYRKEDK